MLFFVNKPDSTLFDRITAIGADEDKALLLVNDAAVFADAFWEEKLEAMNFDDIYVLEESVNTRNIEIGDHCELVDYKEIVDILFNSGKKIISL